MSPVKICFVSSMHPARDKRVFDKEAVSLARAGYVVVHVCPGSPDEDGVEEGVTIRTYPRRKGLLGRVFQLRQLYRLARFEDADVYHCNEVDSWFVGVVLKLSVGSRCVFDVHEHYPSTFAESRFPRWLQPLVAFMVRLAFRILTPFTDRLVLAKQTVSSDFACPAEKKVLVRNFVPLASLRFPQRLAKDVGGAPRTLVHFGLISRTRGWPQILEALALMRNKHLRLEVIGQFNDGSEGDFRARVQALGLAERVEVHPWMKFEQAFARLIAADIGIIAFQPGILNHVYAMPHKMFDYMAAGLAVVLPRFAVEVAPMVEESGCGVLIDPADVHDIATKLDDLLDQPVAMREMGRLGREAVRMRYNWDDEVTRLLGMYNELMAIR